MEINPEILEILKEFKINKDAGLLYLLSVYHVLDISTIIPADSPIITQVNLTQIVVRDYTRGVTKWNKPLFQGQQVEFEWVSDWLDGFKKINKDRAGSLSDATKRMKEFFAKYPSVRVQEVFTATEMYFRTLSSGEYLKTSHKFIFEGAGAAKTSPLMGWVENLRSSTVETSDKDINKQAGQILN